VRPAGGRCVRQKSGAERAGPGARVGVPAGELFWVGSKRRCLTRSAVSLNKQPTALLMHCAVHLWAGLLGYPLDHKTLTWKETHWRTRAYREYPWTLSCMQARPPAPRSRPRVPRAAAAPLLRAGAGAGAPPHGRGRQPLPACRPAVVRVCVQLLSCAGERAGERGLLCRKEGARKGRQAPAACTLRQMLLQACASRAIGSAVGRARPGSHPGSCAPPAALSGGAAALSGGAGPRATRRCRPRRCAPRTRCGAT